MDHDVVIAGGGPVGLLLACELRLAQVSVLVLEKAEAPQSSLKRMPFGIRGLSTLTTEALYRRGLLNDITKPQGATAGADGRGASAAAHWQQQARRAGGHFAGIQFFEDTIDRARWPYRLPSPAVAGMVPVEMEHIEAVLAARAVSSGAEIRRGLGVEGLDQCDEGVTVRAGGESFHGRWLVGCDGGRSMVRRAGGFVFVGTDPEFTGYFAEVEIADREALRPGRHYTPTGLYMYAPPGTVTMADFDGGAFHRKEITRERLEEVLRRVSGTDVGVTAVRVGSTWTDRAYQATAYRNGRVLLAGDAAHIHSPLGGQGLNLGLGDAVNLGWKLAATIRGDAPAGLLDTYESERHPVGAQVLDWSRAQVALMRPSRSSRALEAIIRDLVATRDGATYFAERVWGVGLRYGLGGGHPLVGRSAPDFALTDGRKLGDLLATGKGLLLDFDARPSLRALAERWRDRIAYVASDAEDRLGLSAVLVRPDGFVAWAAEAASEAEDAAQAVSRWFGEAEGVPATI